MIINWKYIKKLFMRLDYIKSVYFYSNFKGIEKQIHGYWFIERYYVNKDIHGYNMSVSEKYGYRVGLAQSVACPPLAR